MLCLLLGLSSKYQGSLVSLAKVCGVWQAEPCSRSPGDVSGTAGLSRVSACLGSSPLLGVHGITEWLVLDGTFKVHLVRRPCHRQRNCRAIWVMRVA